MGPFIFTVPLVNYVIISPYIIQQYLVSTLATKNGVIVVVVVVDIVGEQKYQKFATIARIISMICSILSSPVHLLWANK